MNQTTFTKLLRQFYSLGSKASIKRQKNPTRFFHSEQLSVGTLELYSACPNLEWKDILEESKKALPMLPSIASDRSGHIEHVIRRLRAIPNANEHLIDCFIHLATSDDCAVRWPGLISTLLARSISDCYPKDDVKNNGEVCKMPILNELMNSLYCNVIFNTELRRLDPLRNRPSGISVAHSVSCYFITNAINRLGLLKDSQTAWLLACVMECLTRRRKNYPLAQFSLDFWEQNVFETFGILIGNGSKSAILLSGHKARLAELGFEFGRLLALSTKAYTDIQQLLNYENSVASTFSLNSLPLVLHLQRNPSIVTEIRNFNNRSLDNLHLAKIYSSFQGSTALQDAKKQLNEYVETTIAIVNEFKESESADYLQRLIQALTKFEK